MSNIEKSYQTLGIDNRDGVEKAHDMLKSINIIYVEKAWRGAIICDEPDTFEKGRDISKLTMTRRVDKNGVLRTVYVRVHEDGGEVKFGYNDKVSFTHVGKTVQGRVKGLKWHKKDDKYGTVLVVSTDGKKYSKSLRGVSHADGGKGSHHDETLKKEPKIDESDKLKVGEDELETKIKEAIKQIDDGKQSPKKSNIGKMLIEMKSVDEKKYKKLLDAYKPVFEGYIVEQKKLETEGTKIATTTAIEKAETNEEKTVINKAYETLSLGSKN